METKIEVDVTIIEVTLNAIWFCVRPYLDTIECDEDITKLRQDYEWIYDLMVAYDNLLKCLPESLREDYYDFIGI